MPAGRALSQHLFPFQPQEEPSSLLARACPDPRVGSSLSPLVPLPLPGRTRGCYHLTWYQVLLRPSRGSEADSEGWQAKVQVVAGAVPGPCSPGLPLHLFPDCGLLQGGMGGEG